LGFHGRLLIERLLCLVSMHPFLMPNASGTNPELLFFDRHVLW